MIGYDGDGGAHEAIENMWTGLEIRAFHHRIAQSESKINTRIRNIPAYHIYVTWPRGALHVIGSRSS